MLSADQILRTIDEAYDARVRGDKEQVQTYWAPGATFRIAGADSLIGPELAGPADPNEAVTALIDRFRFHRARRVQSVVQDNKAAIHWRIDVSTDGREPVTTEILDLWEFRDDGKATSLTQFIDTALARALIA